MENFRLTIKEKLGYGAASTGDSIAYTAIGTYLMFFLTTVAGIDPATAGIVSAVGAVWNAIANPVLGFLADQVRSSMGRRRPMILFFSIPLGIFTFLLFTNFNLPPGIKPIYYGLILMAFWTCYAGFFVPYLALGAEYTEDYEDRTVLRLYASLFNMIGNVITMSLPTLLVGVMERNGISTEAAWSATGCFLGVTAIIAILVTIIASKHKDTPCPRPKEEKSKGLSLNLPSLFKEYISVAGLKPMRYLIIASTMSLICYSILLADLMYFMTFNLGLSSKETPLLLLIRPLFSACMIPVTAKVTKLIDKRGALMLFYGIGAALMIFIRIVGVSNLPLLLVYVFGNATCTCFYWQLMPSIYYDICEYDKLETGKDRRAAIVSFQGLVEAIAAGLGSLILGVILKFAGFDSLLETQTDLAKTWIFNCTTVVPIVFLLIAIFAIYKYPLTRERHAEILAELHKREQHDEGQSREHLDEPQSRDHLDEPQGREHLDEPQSREH